MSHSAIKPRPVVADDAQRERDRSDFTATAQNPRPPVAVRPRAHGRGAALCGDVIERTGVGFGGVSVVVARENGLGDGEDPGAG
jgi:hypothetical protein